VCLFLFGCSHCFLRSGFVATFLGFLLFFIKKIRGVDV
jgi:hypothetical protein